MKLFLLLLPSVFLARVVNGQIDISKLNSNKKIDTVKAACGQCMFGMAGGDCTLAVKIKGKVYFVEGTNIDDHGDAHAKDGFCKKVRTAQVQGEIIENKFKATYFKLADLPRKNFP
jgi:Family of unknown function (DUF6370)